MESHKVVPRPANGNRLTASINGSTESYAYDDGDKLASVVGGGTNKTFGYDAAGRRTSMVSGGLTTTYAYDFESRLVSLAGPGIAAQYAYNGLGARVSAVENRNARTFRRDGDKVTDPVLSDGASSFTPGLSVRNGGSSRFFFDDRMGTATKETDSAQTVTATRTYDAFGNMVSSSGSSPSPFGYAGGYGYQEDATGLKLLGHRYYDPSTGRFLTRDPARDGRNWYAYCNNNPLRWVDPEGLRWYIDPWQGDVYNGSGTPIIVVGEPGPGRPQEAILLLPGQQDPPGFDADDILVGGKWRHLEIKSPFSSSADVVVDRKGRPRVRNPHTARIVPSKESKRLNKVVRRGVKRKGVKVPLPVVPTSFADTRPNRERQKERVLW